MRPSPRQPARWLAPSGARLRRRRGGVPAVARERQKERPEVEFSRAQRRSRRKKRAAQPAARRHVRIAHAECRVACLVREWLPVAFPLARLLHRSRCPFLIAPWSVQGTARKLLRLNP